MYGTIARMKIKPGSLESLQAWAESERQENTPGFIGSYIYQMDNDANELFMVVMFESREAYVRNAQSPEQHEAFQRYMQYLESEPEWHDGEIVGAYQA